MYYPREGLSTHVRMIAAVLFLGSLLSFGLGQALGHWSAFSGTAAHQTSMQRQAASAGATFATANLAAARVRSVATPHTTTEGDGHLADHADHAGHAGEHGHAGKHSDPHKQSDSPKAGTTGSTVGSSGGKASSTS